MVNLISHAGGRPKQSLDYKFNKHVGERISSGEREGCIPWLGTPFVQTSKSGKQRLVGRIAHEGKRLSAHKVMWMLDGESYDDDIFPEVCGDWLCMNIQHWEVHEVEKNPDKYVPKLSMEQIHQRALERREKERKEKEDRKQARIRKKSRKIERRIAYLSRKYPEDTATALEKRYARIHRELGERIADGQGKSK